MRGKTFSLSVLCLCQVLALGLWFSSTAVLPSLIAAYGLSGGHAALLTSAVQIGFVAGTLASAMLGLADRLEPRRFFMLSTLVAAAANGLILLLDPASPAVIACRFVTGACMAGVYPVGMMLAASWARGDMGLLVGLLVAALTLGTATPHLFNAFAGLDWRPTIAIASLAALAAALAINLFRVGPNKAPAPPFRAAAALEAFRDPAMRYANFGYLGHMWELFAMWAWLGLFLDASFRLDPGGPDAGFWARIATFASIGLGGALGAGLGGGLADRYGRTTVTMAAMLASGGCCLVVGLLYGGPPVALFLLCTFWGATVIADSAQFSSSVAELAPPGQVGTMLTTQTCAGFLLTLVTIQLMAPLAELLTWRYAFMMLALGPAFGVWAMWRLRRRPEAARLAGGRR